MHILTRLALKNRVIVYYYQPFLQHSSLLQEIFYPVHRLFQVFERICVAYPYKVLSRLAESAARNYRDFLIREQFFRELFSVHTRNGHAREHVKRALRFETGQFHLVKSLDKKSAPYIVLTSHLLDRREIVFESGTERVERRVLSSSRRAHYDILMDLEHLF